MMRQVHTSQLNVRRVRLVPVLAGLRPHTSNEEPFLRTHVVTSDHLRPEEKNMGRGLLLWLIGIPLPIILLIWLFGGLH
jgi:hypothetical protein